MKIIMKIPIPTFHLVNADQSHSKTHKNITMVEFCRVYWDYCIVVLNWIIYKRADYSQLPRAARNLTAISMTDLLEIRHSKAVVTICHGVGPTNIHVQLKNALYVPHIHYQGCDYRVWVAGGNLRGNVKSWQIPVKGRLTSPLCVLK